MRSMRHTSRVGGDVSGLLLEMVRSNKGGVPVGLYSICSANRFVLEAGMKQAGADDTVLCIESTSNQVNQFGGYIGMQPADFARFVRTVAACMKFPAERIILGGDHLGPHVWQNEPAALAMSKARDLVRDCVMAGYTKIHLDASMRCADDPGNSHTPPGDEVVTERVVELCRVAESAHAELPAGSPAPLYVIGTEVPVPGGEHEAGSAIAVTSVPDAERTVALARNAFLAQGLESAWDRVIATVVQPGVDFSDSWILEYDHEKGRPLSSFIEKNWGLIFEAHSTDYQPAWALKQMVEDHFAILKVGPWLTFAFREAVFALAEMENEWLSGRKPGSVSRIREVLDQSMLANPAHLVKYYQGNEADLLFARKYSTSDRSRYYWAQPEVQQALSMLVRNLSENPVPRTLLSQYMPVQYQRVRERRIENTPADLIHDKILEVMDVYACACGMR
jgi:D-tagatose-1,6-bisphosphate aldolase subunit GatZ/KbaZ